MNKYVVSARADQDLERIWRYIAKSSAITATRYLEKLASKFSKLASQPLMGSPADDICPDLRSFAVDNYIVLHRAILGGVEIVRVIHGARDSEASYPLE